MMDGNIELVGALNGALSIQRPLNGTIQMPKEGYSPTVTITEIEGGHRITITDEEGDHSYDVMDGVDGLSPTVTVATEIDAWGNQEVSNSRVGFTLTITDVNGTTTTSDIWDSWPLVAKADKSNGVTTVNFYTNSSTPIATLTINDGVDGEDGEGVPLGGTAGQVLVKSSGADFDTEWTTLDASDVGALPDDTSIPSTAADVGAIPAPVSASDGDVLTYDDGEWVAAPPAASHDLPSGGTSGQVLAKASGTDYDVEWVDQSGGGGTGDYDDLTDKPSINNVTLSGNKSASDLGLAAAGDVPTKTSDLTNDSGFGTYSKPSGGIPKTDLESDVQTSLGKADTALQSYTETDPTVPAWAKTTNKPTYTADEVGAIEEPANRASGDFLMWDGTDWIATTPTKAFYGTSSSAADATAKAVTVTGFTADNLTVGTRVTVSFSNGNSSYELWTLNVNSTGAKSVYYGGSGNGIYFEASTVVDFVYSGSTWNIVGVRPSNGSSSFYGVCSSAVDELNKTVNIPGFTSNDLTLGVKVTVTFYNGSITEGGTMWSLNVSNTGAKSVVLANSSAPAQFGVLATLELVYRGDWQVVGSIASVNTWGVTTLSSATNSSATDRAATPYAVKQVMDAVPAPATATPSDLGTAAVGSSTKYAKEDHVHRAPTINGVALSGASNYSAQDLGLVGDSGTPSWNDILVYDESEGEYYPKPMGKIWSGFSTTASNQQNKAVTITGLNSDTLVEGTLVAVGFNQAQAYEGVPTLNVSNTGAKQIMRSDGVSAGFAEWNAKEVVLFMLSGNYWMVIGGNKIGDPTLKDTGDVLTWDGVKWLASAPAAPGDKNWTGACTTAAGTAAKVAAIAGFTSSDLADGVLVTVGFAYDQTEDNPTLNVSGTGAYPIATGGNAISGGYLWASGQAKTFMFASEHWIMVDHTVLENSYSSVSSFTAPTSYALSVVYNGLNSNKIDNPATKTSGQFLKWNGSAWVADNAPGGGGGLPTGGSDGQVVAYDDGDAVWKTPAIGIDESSAVGTAIVGTAKTDTPTFTESGDVTASLAYSYDSQKHKLTIHGITASFAGSGVKLKHTFEEDNT